MKKIYYLSTCDTCKKIMGSLDLKDDFIRQDLKTEPVSEEQLKELHALSGSYEALFNKRARLYKERGLKDQNLQESDFKALILEHYTFLKRPVFVIDNEVFIGNSKATVKELATTINEK
jgi:arsenate reductase